MSPRERGGTMNEAATPRVRRPSWRDPRLGVGVLLVAGSVALGSWTVSRADDTVTVYTTATVLSPGDQVDVEDLVATQVQVPALAETYLTPGEEPATGLVVLRTVGEGEEHTSELQSRGHLVCRLLLEKK